MKMMQCEISVYKTHLQKLLYFPTIIITNIQLFNFVNDGFTYDTM